MWGSCRIPLHTHTVSCGRRGPEGGKFYPGYPQNPPSSSFPPPTLFSPEKRKLPLKLPLPSTPYFWTVRKISRNFSSSFFSFCTAIKLHHGSNEGEGGEFVRNLTFTHIFCFFFLTAKKPNDSNKKKTRKESCCRERGKEKKERWRRRLISHFTFSFCFVSRASQLLFLLLAFTVLEWT